MAWMDVINIMLLVLSLALIVSAVKNILKKPHAYKGVERRREKRIGNQDDS